jgi:hypothetical protein
MTSNEFHERAKRLAAETQDLWECQILLKIADRHRLREISKTVKNSNVVPRLVVIGKPTFDQ